jgi:hypothetical protein
MANLASLRLPALLDALAEGLRLVAEHVSAIERIAEAQDGRSARAVEVLRVVSDEEAGKYLILLDVARAAYADASVKADQLRRAGNHLAKGIYARSVDINPADFAELVRFVHGLRLSHYLDGPNDVDWIFRNRIEAEREEKLYVDYVASDDGDMWITPRRYDDIGPDNPSGAVKLVLAMSRAGFSNAIVLAAVADVWRSFLPEPRTTWGECRELNRATIESIPVEVTDEELGEDDIARILETWPFPMHGVEMTKIEVDLEELRQRQREWDPDGRTRNDYDY